MKITPMQVKNNNTLSFGDIQYKSFNPKHNSQKELLKREIDTFSSMQENATYLGSGLLQMLMNLKNILTL